MSPKGFSMWKLLQTISEPKSLRDPLLIVCLSTSNPEYKLLYSQAKELGRFLLKKIQFQQISSLYSSALPPEVKVSNQGVSNLINNSFYLYCGSSRDYVLLAGHSSPIEDQFEYGETVLSYAQRIGVREIVSFGARWTETVVPPLEEPRITAFASDEEGSRRLEKAGIAIQKNESAYYFVNILTSLSKFYGMRGYKISVDHGEPAPNPRSLIAFLEVLSEMFGLRVDDSDLHLQARELDESMRKAAIDGFEDGSKGSQNDDIYR